VSLGLILCNKYSACVLGSIKTVGGGLPFTSDVLALLVEVLVVEVDMGIGLEDVEEMLPNEL